MNIAGPYIRAIPYRQNLSHVAGSKHGLIRSITLWLTVVFVLLALPFSARAEAPKEIVSGPVPDWVEPVGLGKRHPANQVTGGVDYLLVDRQWRAPGESYSHYAYVITQSNGLESGSEISFGYSPEYQTVSIHKVNLIRNGKNIDQLDLNQIEVLREERDRGMNLYDGRITAVLHLKDVRVGDAIEYAMTTTGQNPIFGNRFFTQFEIGWASPVSRRFNRIYSTREHRLHLNYRGPMLSPPAHTTQDEYDVLTWFSDDNTTISPDARTPYWYDSYPSIQAGEFSQWSEVVDWALPLYQFPSKEQLAPSLQEECARIRTLSDEPQIQLLNLLKFVQNDIRYLGLELGEGSHRPRPAEETLASRFGDCKDKTVLFCTLARAMGWNARPALVHSYRGKALAGCLPSPLLFNHVIATVLMPDGQRIWLDPTDRDLAGDLEQHSAPDYGSALIIEPGQTALTKMNLPFLARGRTRERLIYTSRGFNQPGILHVTTRYYGEQASAMRRYVHSVSKAEFEKSYLNYYSTKYPGVKPMAPLTWADDSKTNIFKVTEHYSIPVLWTLSEKGTYSLELTPWTIGEYVQQSESSVRTSPLAISYPKDIETEITVNLHTEWLGQPFERNVDDPAFNYHSEGKITNREVALRYTYKTKDDHVTLDHLKGYLDHLNTINSTLVYRLKQNTTFAYTPTLSKPAPAQVSSTLTTPSDTPPPVPAAPLTRNRDINWRSIVVISLCLAGAYLLFSHFKKRNLQPPMLGTNNEPSGLGGWLILVGIGTILRPLQEFHALVKGRESYFFTPVWDALTLPASPSYHPALAWLILGELAYILSMLLFSLIVIWLFFTKRKEAPRMLIISLFLIALFSIADITLVKCLKSGSIDQKTYQGLLQAIIQACIWIPYFTKSRRVANTFVR